MSYFENKTIEKMVAIYCRHHHSQNIPQSICDSCQEILNYSLKRIKYCPLSENKPVCSKCHIHCYEKEPREKIKEIMRFSGPRMIWRHPILAIGHLIRSKLK